MATPNYGFEKRQKELAKKRKKEEKLKAKSDRKSGLVSEDGSLVQGAVDTLEPPVSPLSPETGNSNPPV